MVLTCVLMAILMICIAIITLYGVKFDKDKNSLMDVHDSNFLRGFWCIIVVLVHVPAAYQNRLQDMMGSFAYIGVTFFFMTSAYGLKYSIINKPNYMKSFWRRRLLSLLVPAIIANAFSVIMGGVNGASVSFFSFVNINDWVKVLLLMYLGFWLVYGVLPKVGLGGNWQDIVMISYVVVCSLVQRFTNLNIMWAWIAEPLGFAYGIIVAKYTEEIKSWISKNWILKTWGLMIVSLILGVAYLKFKPIPVLGDYWLKIILGIAITCFMLCLIAKIRVGNKVNSFLGNISYEIFLLHGGVFLLLMALSKNVMNSGAFIMALVVITICLAFVLNSVSSLIVKGLNKKLRT